MKNRVLSKATSFKGVNDIAMKGEIVVFGSTYMANFPFYELINNAQIESAVYNRSIENLTLEEAKELIEPCVTDLEPKKVFLALGDEDYDHPESFSTYREIVNRIHKQLPDAKIYMVCLPEERAAEMNCQIEEFCDGKKIICLPLTLCKDGKSVPSLVYKHQFKELSCFFRKQPISITDAFALAGI